jgi:AbrB family looped-hinge helix DNA binding protein
LSIEVRRYGRLVLPKELRDRYGVEEGSRLIAAGVKGRIVLLPVRIYDRPTEALYGSVKVEEPVEEPKRVAREYIRTKMVEGLG